MERLLTAQEVAHVLGLDSDGHKAPTEAVRYLCRSGQMRYCKVSGRPRFRREWVEEFIRTNTVEPVR